MAGILLLFCSECLCAQVQSKFFLQTFSILMPLARYYISHSPHFSIVQVTAGLGTWNHYHDACITTHLPVPASENHQESRQHAAHWRGTSVSHIDAAWREESGQGQRAQTLRKKTHVHRKIFGVFFLFLFFYLSTALINCLRQDIFKNKQNIWSKNQLPIGGQSIRTGD